MKLIWTPTWTSDVQVGVQVGLLELLNSRIEIAISSHEVSIARIFIKI